MSSQFLPLRRHQTQLIAGTTLLLLLALLALFWRARQNSVLSFLSATNSAAAAEANSVAVKRGDVRKLLLLDGELRAVRSRTVYANISDEAKIVFLPPEGSVVKAGELLVELDSTAVLSKIQDTEERLVAAESEVVRNRAQHEAALRDLEIELSKLWLAFEQGKIKAKVPAEVVPRREYQDNQLALEKAEAEYNNQLSKIEQRKKEQAAELQVKSIEKDKLQVQLDRDRSKLDGMRIKAPTDGMVIYNDHWQERRKLQVGDMVWSGFPIVFLPDLTEMEVLSRVNEVDGPKLSVGNQAQTKIDSFPDSVFTGQVKEISETAVKASWMAKAKVFRVAIGLDRTATEMMKPGMSAQVGIIISETKGQLLVPRAAVKFAGEGATVTRRESATQQRSVAVTVLAADAVNYAVADNGALKEGDRLLIP
jgi:HlyD family secretion protein